MYLCNVIVLTCVYLQMLAYGKITQGGRGPLKIGLEFSGTDTAGRAVFGLSSAGCMATAVRADPEHLWAVPAGLSLEQACTLPVIYSTAYYALVILSQVSAGSSVLIHSIAGGVGQAAYHLCRHRECVIFCSCSRDKREWVHATLGIPWEHILDSHSAGFRDELLWLTGGRGVDVSRVPICVCIYTYMTSVCVGGAELPVGG